MALGHKSSLITRAVCVQEIKSAERTARRRARMEARYGQTFETAAGTRVEPSPVEPTCDLVDLLGNRVKAP